MYFRSNSQFQILSSVAHHSQLSLVLQMMKGIVQELMLKLSFISKRLERIATTRFDNRPMESNLTGEMQPAYRTERALHTVQPLIVAAVTQGHVEVLLVLDLSAAFGECRYYSSGIEVSELGVV